MAINDHEACGQTASLIQYTTQLLLNLGKPAISWEFSFTWIIDDETFHPQKLFSISVLSWAGKYPLETCAWLNKMSFNWKILFLSTNQFFCALKKKKSHNITKAGSFQMFLLLC